MIFVRRTINSRQVVVNSQTYENIKITLTFDKFNIHLLGVYRPPDTNKTVFVQELESLVETFPDKDKVVLIGDFYVMEQESNSPALVDSMAALSPSNCIQGVTREEIREGCVSATCIDLIFVKGADAGCSAIIRNKISDHYTVALSMKLDTAIVPRLIVKTVLNEIKVKNMLNNVNWNEYLYTTLLVINLMKYTQNVQ